MHDYRNKTKRLIITVNQAEGLYSSAAKMIGTKENTLTLPYTLDDGEGHLQRQNVCTIYITKIHLAEQNAMTKKLSEFTPDLIAAMKKFVKYLQNGF